MILNPITTETELRVACSSIIATNELERVIDYFVREAWNEARHNIKDDREVNVFRKILKNYEDLGNKIKFNAVSATKPELNF